MCLVSMVLLALLLCELFICSYTDVKAGKIYNKVILLFSLAALPIQIIEIIQAHLSVDILLTNFLFVSITSILFYLIKIWAAGDAKLMMSLSLVFPCHYYWPIGLRYFPASSLIITCIAGTYIFILADTVVHFILDFNTFRKTWIRIVTRGSIKSFFMNWLCLVAIFDIFAIINNYFFHMTEISFILSASFTMLLLGGQVSKFYQFWPVALAFEIGHLFIADSNYKAMTIKLVIATGAFIIGRVIQIFNYKIIDASRLETGMIISALSVNELINNYNINLAASEDHNARISVSDVENVRNTGIDKVRIVRKMPFAIFVLVSVIFYIGALIWQIVY